MIIYRVNLTKLLERLVELPPAEVSQKPMRKAVCMNETRPCEQCIFNEGANAEWCLPHERAAKAATQQTGVPQ